VELGGACEGRWVSVGRAGYARWPRATLPGRPAVGLCVGEEHLLARRRQRVTDDRTVAHGLGARPSRGDHRLVAQEALDAFGGRGTRARAFMRPPHAGHGSDGPNPNVRAQKSDHPMYDTGLPEGGAWRPWCNAGELGPLCGGGGGRWGGTQIGRRRGRMISRTPLPMGRGRRRTHYRWSGGCFGAARHWPRPTARAHPCRARRLPSETTGQYTMIQCGVHHAQ